MICAELLSELRIHDRIYLWSRRLTVRTLGSHPNNRGSIPREITIFNIIAFFIRDNLGGAKFS